MMIMKTVQALFVLILSCLVDFDLTKDIYMIQKPCLEI